MKVDYTNPYIYYYEPIIRPAPSPTAKMEQISKTYRIVEPIEKGKIIDQYA